MTHTSLTNALSNELLQVFRETLWPTALATLDGRVLAVSQPLLDLCGTPHIAVGTACETLLPAAEHVPFHALLQHVRDTACPAFITTELLCHDQSTLAVELEAFATPAAAPQWITLTWHYPSRVHRREQLLLALNWLVPKLLVAQSAAEVFAQVGKSLRKLGINTTIMRLDAPARSLTMEYHTATRPSVDLFEQESQSPLPTWRFSIDIPGYREAIREQRTIYWDDLHAHTIAAVPPAVVPFAEQILALRGVNGLLIAPLRAQHDVRGLLVVWSYALQAADIAWTEALAYQISTALEQIDLRAQMAAQMQRQASLAETARAVTRLGTLDEVLRVICEQAMHLLHADCASVHLPTSATHLSCVMATGLYADLLVHIQIPLEGSLTGKVQLDGTGFVAADMRDEPEAYHAIVDTGNIASCLLQPLLHHGAVLGVLFVGHCTPGYLQQADLDFLARYAEYAAVAVANAQLHNALHQSEQRYRRLSEQSEADRTYLHALIEYTPDVMFTIRRDMTLHVLTPKRIETVFGYDHDDVEGQPLLRFVTALSRERVLKYWQSILDGQAQTMELQIIKADGGQLPALVSAVRVPEYNEVFVILKDLTEIKLLEANVRRVESLAALGRMAAGTAHELNNPLAIILGMTQLVLLEELPHALRNDLKSIETAALRAAGIIEQLRAFSTHQPIQPNIIDLALLVHAVLDRSATECALHGITVSHQLANDLPPIAGNYMQLEQAIVNLCHNAIQALAATPPEHPRHLMIRAWSEPNCVRLTITDTGLGVTPEQLPYIFEPFYTTRPAGHGAGLGLAIVHTLVEQHGGRIWAESVLGEWTTFQVTFPSAPAQPVISDGLDAYNQAGAFPRAQSSPPLL